MSRNYKFYNPEGVYFVSFAVVEWLDACLASLSPADEAFGEGLSGAKPVRLVFTRNEYKDIVLDSLQFCQKEKGILNNVIVIK